MPFYNYMCQQGCQVSQLSEEQREKLPLEDHPDGLVVWTEQHGMNDEPEIKCPVCKQNAARTWHGTTQTFYFPGNCYLNREDCRRHMDLRLLESGNDPYSHMRQPGEVDELKTNLKKKKTPRK